jgi:hypothetical protein
MMIGIVFEVYDDWYCLWSIWLGLFMKYMMIGIVFELYDNWDCFYFWSTKKHKLSRELLFLLCTFYQQKWKGSTFFIWWAITLHIKCTLVWQSFYRPIKLLHANKTTKDCILFLNKWSDL